MFNGYREMYKLLDLEPKEFCTTYITIYFDDLEGPALSARSRGSDWDFLIR